MWDAETLCRKPGCSVVRPSQIWSVAFGHPPKMTLFQLVDDILIQCHLSRLIYVDLHDSNPNVCGT